MKAVLRPAFVLGLSIAIAATSVLGSSSVAYAGTTRPTITDWPATLTVNEGDKPTIHVTFTDTDGPGFYAYDVFWGDGDSNSDTISAAETGTGPWTFDVTKPTPYAAGEFLLQISVNHGGPANTRFGNVTVLSNQTPRVVSFGVTAGSEGGTSNLALTFADSDALDTHTVSVVWGDRSSSDPVVLPAGETMFGAEHVYAGTGPYAVVLTLKDSANHTVTAGASVSPTNVAPVLEALSLLPSSVVDHEQVTLSGSFTDPGTADTFTLFVNWGDVVSPPQPLGTERSFSVTHAYDAAGTFTITATVEDRDGATSNPSSVALVVLPSNHAPADLLVQATTPVLEGGSTTLSVSFTDAEALDAHTVAITWDDLSTDSVSLSSGLTSTSLTHTYLETGKYTIAVTVTDGGGMFVSGGTTATAINVPPSLASLVLTPSAVTDHQALTVSGTFSDSGTADTYTVLFTWGDGSSSTQSLAAGTRSFIDSHEYATAGTKDMTVTVTDRDGGAGSQYVTVVVTARNTAPSALTLDPSVSGANVMVSASFTDPDALDTHGVVVNWGDDTSTAQDLVAGATTFVASHVYGASRTYTLTATVTDPAGASTSATAQVVVTVPSESAPDVVDQMSSLVLSFDLDRNTERWLLHKLDDLKGSLAYGNSQVCSSTGTLSHILAFAQRTLTSDQYATLSALATKLDAAAGCTSQGNLHPKVLKASTVTMPPTTVTPAPTPKKDTTAKTTKSASKSTEGRPR